MHQFRQIGRFDLGTVAQNHCALDRVSQLAQVPRPAIVFYYVPRFGRKSVDPLAGLCSEELQELIGQTNQIAWPFAERTSYEPRDCRTAATHDA